MSGIRLIGPVVIRNVDCSLIQFAHQFGRIVNKSLHLVQTLAVQDLRSFITCLGGIHADLDGNARRASQFAAHLLGKLKPQVDRVLLRVWIEPAKLVGEFPRQGFLMVNTFMLDGVRAQRPRAQLQLWLDSALFHGFVRCDADSFADDPPRSRRPLPHQPGRLLSDR